MEHTSRGSQTLRDALTWAESDWDPSRFGRALASLLRHTHEERVDAPNTEEREMAVGSRSLTALLLDLPAELIQAEERWRMVQLATAWLSRLREEPVVQVHGGLDVDGIRVVPARNGNLEPALAPVPGRDSVKERDLGLLAAELLWPRAVGARQPALRLLQGVLTGYGASSVVLPLYAAHHGLEMAATEPRSTTRRRTLTGWALRLLAAAPSRRGLQEFLPDLLPRPEAPQVSEEPVPVVRNEPAVATFAPCPLPPEGAVEELLRDSEPPPVVVAGRVSQVRRHRHLAFVDLEADGRRFQVGIPTPLFESASGDRVRVHDQLVVEGPLKRSRTGTPTVFVEAVRAHVPCRLSAEEAAAFIDRFRLHRGIGGVLDKLRTRLHRAGFVEQLTPVLQLGFFGGRSRPFRTWVEDDGRWGYLRATLEKGLKTALASGVPRCFEIGPCFRNEGRDAGHSPEFTILEAYATAASMDEMTELALELIRGTVPRLDRVTSIRAQDACAQRFGVDPEDREGVRTALAQLGLAYEDDERAKISLLKRAAQDFDGVLVLSDVSIRKNPLAARGEEGDNLRWLLADGVMIGEVVREEVDAAKVGASLAAHALDEPTVARKDESFLHILEAGLPPCIGLALGVTRLSAMALGVDNVNDLPLSSTP